MTRTKINLQMSSGLDLCQILTRYDYVSQVRAAFVIKVMPK